VRLDDNTSGEKQSIKLTARFGSVNSRQYICARAHARTHVGTQNETLPCAWQPDDLQSWTRVFSAWKKPTEPRVWIRSQTHWADWNAGAHATGIHQGPKRQRTLSSNGDSTKSSKAWTRWKNGDARRELRGREMNGPWDHS